jgi:ubiquitin-protein ligase
MSICYFNTVDPSSGQPCIDFLDDPDKWNKRYTLGSILLALQVRIDFL